MSNKAQPSETGEDLIAAAELRIEEISGNGRLTVAPGIHIEWQQADSQEIACHLGEQRVSVPIVGVLNIGVGAMMRQLNDAR